MRWLKASWAPVLFLMSALVVDATLDLHNTSSGPGSQVKTLEHSRGGVVQTEKDSVVGLPFSKFNGLDTAHVAATQAQDAKLDIDSLLGQNGAERLSSDTDDTDAHQAAEDRREGLTQSLNGNNGDNQGKYRNQTAPADKDPNYAQTSSSNAPPIQSHFNTSSFVDSKTRPTTVIEVPKARATAATPPASSTPSEAFLSLPTIPTASTAYKPDATPLVVLSPVKAKPTSPQSTTLDAETPRRTGNGTARGTTSTLTVDAEATVFPTARWNATVVSQQQSSKVAGPTSPLAQYSKLSFAALNSSMVATSTMSAEKTSSAELIAAVTSSSTESTAVQPATEAANVISAIAIATTTTNITTIPTTSSAVSLAGAIVAGESPAANSASSATTLELGSSTPSVTPAAAAITVDVGLDTNITFILDLSSASASATAPVSATPIIVEASSLSKQSSSVPNPTLTSTTTVTIIATTSSKPTPYIPQAATHATLGTGPVASTPSGVTDNAAKNGGCHCLCACPVGSFPMAALPPPPLPAFQLGPVTEGSTTLQTVGTARSDASSGAAQRSSSVLSERSTASSASEAMVSAFSSVSVATSMAVQSQTVGDVSSATTLPVAVTADLGQQGNGILFDINTIALASKVTVHLRARKAIPTGT